MNQVIALTAPENELNTLIYNLKSAPFKINIEEVDIQVVENPREMIQKLKAKESILLDKIKLFN